MRILILGAGAVGGYFGGRLVESGVNVTFLVRPARARLLAEKGLIIRSPIGDAVLAVKTLDAEARSERFDLALLACKAYDLDDALVAISPHIDAGAVVMPVLNGMAHIDVLRARFGNDMVAGGIVQLPASLSLTGEVVHLDKMARIVFGRFADQPNPEKIDRLLDGFSAAAKNAKFASHRSDPIDQSLWDKWVMLATLAGMTTLMRSAVGDIMSAKDGRELMAEMLQEIIDVATAAGFRPGNEYLAAVRQLLFDPNSTFTASMLRDMEAGGRTEYEHVIGDMYRRAHDMSIDTKLLRLSYCNLQAYEARRKREAKLMTPNNAATVSLMRH